MSTKQFKFALLSKVKDTVTGFSGVVMSATNYLTGCDRYSVQPTELKDGRPQDPYAIEEWRLELVDLLPKGEAAEFLYANGTQIKDALTGIEGVVVARTTYPSADQRYSIIPRGEKALDDRQKWITIDETQVLPKKATPVALKQPVKSPGGPSRYDAPRR
jgi:hypothetical protein